MLYKNTYGERRGTHGFAEWAAAPDGEAAHHEEHDQTIATSRYLKKIWDKLPLRRCNLYGAISMRHSSHGKISASAKKRRAAKTRRASRRSRRGSRGAGRRRSNKRSRRARSNKVSKSSSSSDEGCEGYVIVTILVTAVTSKYCKGVITSVGSLTGFSDTQAKKEYQESLQDRTKDGYGIFKGNMTHVVRKTTRKVAIGDTLSVKIEFDQGDAMMVSY